MQRHMSFLICFLISDWMMVDLAVVSQWFGCLLEKNWTLITCYYKNTQLTYVFLITQKDSSEIFLLDSGYFFHIIKIS